VKTTRAGTAAALVAVFTWGVGPVVVKLIDLPALTVSFYRLWLGAALAFAVLAVSGGSLNRRVLRTAAPGGLAFGLNLALFFSAVKLTTVTDASIISALQPVLLLFVGRRRFAEPISATEAVCSAVGVAGVALVVLAGNGRGQASVVGDLLAVGALLTWAWYFSASKAARRSLGALEYQTALGLIAAVVVTPVVLVGVGVGSMGVRGGGSLLGLAVLAVGPGGGHLLMNWAHAHTKLALASLLTLLSPVVTAVGGALLLDEPVGGWQVVGMAVVLASLAVVVVNANPPDQRRPRCLSGAFGNEPVGLLFCTACRAWPPTPAVNDAASSWTRPAGA
jgi:drug/metabolite transporter (DMT)-like permease